MTCRNSVLENKISIVFQIRASKKFKMKMEDDYELRETLCSSYDSLC